MKSPKLVIILAYLCCIFYIPKTISNNLFDGFDNEFLSNDSGAGNLQSEFNKLFPEEANLISTSLITNGNATQNDQVNNNSNPKIDKSDNESAQYEADLSVIAKVSSNFTPVVETTITFTLVALNYGPNDATGVEVLELLPSGYSYISNNATQGNYDPNSGIWTIGNLSSGSNAILVITVFVNAVGEYKNVATISGDQSDPDQTNNSDEETPEPIHLTDLSVVLETSNLSPKVGESVVFKITAKNNGPSNATNVRVNFPLPDGFSFIGQLPSDGNYNLDQGIWFINDLPLNNEAIVEITVVVNPDGAYIAETNILGDEQDTDLQNNSDQDILFPIPQADLIVIRESNSSQPKVGELTEIVLIAKNNGPSTASQVAVTSQLPNGLTYVDSKSSVGSYNHNTGQWTIGNMMSGTKSTLEVQALVNATGSYANVASITGYEEDPDPENNFDEGYLNPIPQTDLSIEIEPLNAAYNGGILTFLITASNFGPSDATHVAVQNDFSSQYIFQSYNTTYGTFDKDSGTWNIGDLAYGEEVSLQLHLQIDGIESYTNQVSIRGEEEETQIDNNLDSVLIHPNPSADLLIKQTIDQSNPEVQSEVFFTIEVQNNGPNDASNVYVEQLLPTGFTYLSSETEDGTYDSSAGIWTIGELELNTVTTLELRATVNTHGNYTNTVTLFGDEYDLDSSNNSKSLSIAPVFLSDVSMHKTIDHSFPNVGETLNIIVSLENNGPNDATGLEIEEKLPLGFTYVSGSASQSGTYDPSSRTIRWSDIIIENQASYNLSYAIIVNPPSTLPITSEEYRSFGQIIGLNQKDPDSMPNNGIQNEDDEAVLEITIQQTDIQIDKSVNKFIANVHDTVIFTLMVTNTGLHTATNIEILENFDIDYEYLNHSGGNYNPNTGIWTIDEISKNTSVSLSVELKVLSPTSNDNSYFSSAELTKLDQFDVDSFPNNHNEQEDDYSSVITELPATDLGINIQVSDHSPIVNNTVTFTLTAENLGLYNATNIVLEDYLPSGYDYVLSNALEGNYESYTGEWQIANLNAGEQAILHIEAIVKESGDYLNAAFVLTLDQKDTNDENNAVSIEVNPVCLTVYNEFSPNNDGVNDYFIIDCIDQYPNNHLEVFNRWGNLVYKKLNYDNSWDAISNGIAAVNTNEKLPVGTYYYVLDIGDGSIPKKGWLYINR